MFLWWFFLLDKSPAACPVNWKKNKRNNLPLSTQSPTARIRKKKGEKEKKREAEGTIQLQQQLPDLPRPFTLSTSFVGWNKRLPGSASPSHQLSHKQNFNQLSFYTSYFPITCALYTEEETESVTQLNPLFFPNISGIFLVIWLPILIHCHAHRWAIVIIIIPLSWT